ncbi:hypothetical protein H9P43_000922 [Blastocladiella emersonii ATCC 22665]|nr:hypothetical protein H9P43_000922 [Blastocladiella emersonii ATCC 22665]
MSPPVSTVSPLADLPTVESIAPTAKSASSAAPEVPVPQSMGDLVALLKEELGPNGLDSSDVDVTRIVRLMESYTSNADDWRDYALFDPYRYTRNLVDDGNGKFNLIILCWGAGHASPIHDHANSHCCMKMLEGNLTETRYEFPGEVPADHVVGESEADANRVRVIGQKTMERDQVAYINDSLGLHRVSNPSATAPAISLHLYTPPIQMCKTFCERTGVARPASQCVFYSKNGQRCPPVAPAHLLASAASAENVVSPAAAVEGNEPTAAAQAAATTMGACSSVFGAAAAMAAAVAEVTPKLPSPFAAMCKRDTTSVFN